MLAAFRKFGVAEYAIAVRFVTMTEEQALKAFPDTTSSLLTSSQNPSTGSEAAPLVSEIPPVYNGQPAVRARTIIEEDSTMRFRVIDKDALAKLLEAANADRRTNVLEAPLLTTYNEQTASLCRSKWPPLDYAPRIVIDSSHTAAQPRPLAEKFFTGLRNLFRALCRIALSVTIVWRIL